MTARLEVEWPACRARGLCSELLPELIDLDEWGYPIVLGPVPDSLERSARATVRACPTLALRLVRDPTDEGRPHPDVGGGPAGQMTAR